MSIVPPNMPLRASEDLVWRQQLRDTLRDCGAHRAGGSRALRWSFNVFVVLLIGLISFVVNKIIDSQPHNPDAEIVARAIWYVLAVFVLARIRNRALRVSWKTWARDAEEELERDGRRRPILYLRSFQLDERISRPSLAERFLGLNPMANAEQELAKAMRKYGPAIAIGRPDEKLPELGVARFYVSHDRWKDKVADVARLSQFVVLATGVTEGLRWEISHLVATLPPENLILWAHPHLLRLNAQQREKEWTRFRAAHGALFPKSLPVKLGEARFIYFTADWEPHAVAPPRGIVPWFNGEAAALKAVMAAKQAGSQGAAAVDARAQEDADFATLIGATGDEIGWPRAAAFFVALVVSQLPYIYSYSGFSTRPFVWPLLLAPGAVAAFRYFRSHTASVLAAILPALFLYPWKSEVEYFQAGLLFSLFVQNVAFLGGLSWATLRLAPLPLALWVGAMCSPLSKWLLAFFGVGTSPFEIEYGWSHYLLPLLPPILFAGSFSVALMLLPGLLAGSSKSQPPSRV